MRGSIGLARRLTVIRSIRKKESSSQYSPSHAPSAIQPSPSIVAASHHHTYLFFSRLLFPRKTDSSSTPSVNTTCMMMAPRIQPLDSTNASSPIGDSEFTAEQIFEIYWNEVGGKEERCSSAENDPSNLNLHACRKSMGVKDFRHRRGRNKSRDLSLPQSGTV